MVSSGTASMGIAHLRPLRIGAEVVADVKTGDGSFTGVDDADKIGYTVSGPIAAGKCGFTGGKYFHQSSGGDVGTGTATTVGKGSLIIKNCHWYSSCKICWNVPANQSMRRKRRLTGTMGGKQRNMSISK